MRPYCLSSAICGDSRRNSVVLPASSVSWAYCLLAGRSLAAILLLGRYAEHRGLPAFLPPRARVCCTSGEPAAQPGFAGASREAARCVPHWPPYRNATCHFGRARIYSWLSRQICGRAQGRSRNVACEMKRAGLEPAANWRVSHRARAEPCRSRPSDGRRCEPHWPFAESLSERMVRLGEAGDLCRIGHHAEILEAKT